MKTLNVVLLGTGKIGSSLINQIIQARDHLKENEGLDIRIPVIANSSTAYFQKESCSSSWETDFKSFGFPYRLEDVLEFVSQQEYENLVAVDATASEDLVDQYVTLVRSGFHLVVANKAANTRSTSFYDDLRETLKKNERYFFYETNVGAGLPVIETLRNFQRSHEEVRAVRGVFSGSMSYIFNTFCAGEKDFSEVLTEACDKGFTEPDPRIDLSGKDVGRKLLILGRELGLRKEMKDIVINDLVPKHLNGNSSVENFQKNKKDLDLPLRQLKEKLKPHQVIRHVGELDVKTGKLEVRLSIEDKDSPLGSLKNADSSFEIFTRSYGKDPLVIRGAGAGPAVTARGVLTDLIKLAEKIT